MKEFKTLNEILIFAINAEQEAVDFYVGLAVKSKNEQMKKVFAAFAVEEMKHKSRLLAIKENNIFRMTDEKVQDLKIADYLENVAVSPEMTYQDALIVAMKKEKNAFKLYLLLSEQAGDPAMKDLFLSLAQEEAKHKLRFELEYDEFILREN
ncbi:MAG: ferritin family protein [Bacteroidetes bacterium]|nr:ferritin family protein [Bacteroidota bacterium]